MVPFFVVFSLVSFQSQGENKDQFLTKIQFSLLEDNPRMSERSKKLILERFSQIPLAIAQLEGRDFEVEAHGHHLDLLLTSAQDLRHALQREMILAMDELSPKVRVRGRSLFYRTAFSPVADLEVDVDPDQNLILSTKAERVPLIEFLRVLRSKLDRFSYFVSEGCSDVRINWAFDESKSKKGKKPEVLLTDLEKVSGIRWKKTGEERYVFSGCHPVAEAAEERMPIAWPPFDSVPYRSRVLLTGWD